MRVRPEKAIFPNQIEDTISAGNVIFQDLKEIAFYAEKEIFLNLKGSLFEGARKNLTLFRASWRPEETNFPNLE